MAAASAVKRQVFLLITTLCVAVAVLYTFYFAATANAPVGRPASAAPVSSALTSLSGSSAENPAAQSRGQPDQPSGSPAATDAATPPHERPEPLPAASFLVALNVRHSAEVGTVEFAALGEVDERRTSTNLSCERIYFAAGTGICLRREIEFFSSQTVATLVDTRFQPLFSVRIDGIPSRARISPDGHYAAFTVFVTGHSYGDAMLSTATLLLDLDTRATIANLEEFTVLQNGDVIDSIDRNYWGVTFQQDSNFFYATLRMRGVNYLVRGDIRLKTVSVITEGVECPSLSPDETRIAFKKMISRNNWRLTVLDLTTFEETPLAETTSVDDQAEWLDNNRVLYAVADPSPWMSIKVVPADGTGQPSVFAKGADSPAVIRIMPAGSRLGTD